MYARTTAGLVLLFVSAALAAAASGVPQSPPPRIGDGMPPSDTAHGAGASATYYDRNGKPVSISGTFAYAKGPGLTGTPFRSVVLQSGSDTIYIRQERWDDGEISIRIQAADGTWKGSYKVWLTPPRRSNTPTPIPTPTNPVIAAPPAASPVATPPTTAAATPSRNSVLPRGASARGTSGMNVDKAADKLNAIALPGAVGHCALHVQQALEAGGVGGAGHHLSYAHQYGPYLLSLGFISVLQEGYQPQKGDIVVIQPDPKRGGPGHIAMYDGSQWISDHKQRDSLDTGIRISNLAEQPNRKRYRFYRP